MFSLCQMHAVEDWGVESRRKRCGEIGARRASAVSKLPAVVR
jgi:hypothetical protein